MRAVKASSDRLRSLAIKRRNSQMGFEGALALRLQTAGSNVRGEFSITAYM